MFTSTGRSDEAPDDAPSADAVPLPAALEVGDRGGFPRDGCRDDRKFAFDPDRQSGSSARAETWRLGVFSVTRAATTGTRFMRRLSRSASDNGELWVFRLSREPVWTSVGEDGISRVGPGQLWMNRATHPSLTVPHSGDYTFLTFPAEACPELSAGLSHLPAGVLTGPGAGMLADMLAALPARLRATPASGLGPLAEVLRSVIACSLLGDLEMARVQAAAKGPLLRDRVIRVIADNIGSARLDVERICRLAGVSRSVLYRMFERDGGVARHVREVRLRLVLADLHDPALAHVPISRIAERRGLHNAASFSRAFRQKFDCSPSEARAAVALGMPPAALARGEMRARLARGSFPVSGRQIVAGKAGGRRIPAAEFGLTGSGPTAGR